MKHAIFVRNLLVSSIIAAMPVFAQSGDISADTGEALTLGGVLLKLAFGLAISAVVGVGVFGAAQLGTNKQKGLAMIAGAFFGALCIGLIYAIVSTLTGHNISGS